MVNQPAVLLLSAVVTLMLGLALVLQHNIWVMDWQVLVTILCWIVFLKGLFLLFFPKKAELSMALLQNKAMMGIIWIIDLSLAIALIYYGFCVS